jgi:hypothetical protein
MTTSLDLRPRMRRDPALGLWAVAGAGWVVTLALVLTGGAEAGHHDHVLEGSA